MLSRLSSCPNSNAFPFFIVYENNQKRADGFCRKSSSFENISFEKRMLWRRSTADLLYSLENSVFYPCGKRKRIQVLHNACVVQFHEKPTSNYTKAKKSNSDTCFFHVLLTCFFYLWMERTIQRETGQVKCKTKYE